MSAQLVLFFALVISLLSSDTVGLWPLHNHVQALEHSVNVKQVAIIGAGAAGSSAAYHLQKFAKRDGVDINITIFEKSSYVGGRSTTVNAYDDPSYPVELGASIFVEINKILKNATTEFDLEIKVGSAGDEPETLGIWNGEKFVFTQKDGGWAWWDITKLIWKYGLAPIRTQRLVKATVGKFLKMYDPPFFPFRSLSNRAEDLELLPYTGVTGEQLLTANNIGPPFTTDIVQASTRVNYGQNLGLIHGLETMVCMSIEGAVQIKGGNWQIFDRMINASGSTLALQTKVTAIEKQDDRYIISTEHALDKTSEADRSFDTVILASPLQFSDIELETGLLKHMPDNIPYVKLHVTLFTSPYKINGSLFNLGVGDVVPDTILTTLSPDEDPKNRSDIVGKAGFFSISTLRSTVNPKTARKEYIYKIFSPKVITSQFLSDLLGVSLPSPAKSLVESPTEAISWYCPFVWHSYPYEYPRVTFEEIELAEDFYYTSGIESFISTMETSALMGMNIAQLIVDDYLNVLGSMPMDDVLGTQIEKSSNEEL